jgi:hypothetical protein
MTAPPPSVEMWRCRECGKWSHAKRRPLRHKRFAGDLYDVTDERLIAEVHWGREHDTGAWVESLWVWCGPFDRYEARHSDSHSPPALDPEKLPKPREHGREDYAPLPADDAEVPF